MNAEAATRAEKALTLHVCGIPYRLIAKQCGYPSERAAYAAVQRALNDPTRQESAAQVRQRELACLDRLFAAYIGKALAGDLRAKRLIDKIMKRRNRYLGLEAPKSTALSGTPVEWRIVGMDVEQL